MDYRINSTALTQADEVLKLFRAYRAAGLSVQEMGFSATIGFDPADLARYAHTDLMPIRIKGQLYVVSEYVASTIAAAAQQMLQWQRDSHVDALALCIQNLEQILRPLHQRRSVTITCISPREWAMSIAAPGTPEQIADAVAVMVSLAALGLNQFSIEQLLAQTARLVPA